MGVRVVSLEPSLSFSRFVGGGGLKIKIGKGPLASFFLAPLFFSLTPPSAVGLYSSRADFDSVVRGEGCHRCSLA